jgi:hypothetical protein
LQHIPGLCECHFSVKSIHFRSPGEGQQELHRRNFAIKGSSNIFNRVPLLLLNSSVPITRLNHPKVYLFLMVSSFYKEKFQEGQAGVKEIKERKVKFSPFFGFSPFYC